MRRLLECMFATATTGSSYLTSVSFSTSDHSPALMRSR